MMFVLTLAISRMVPLLFLFSVMLVVGRLLDRLESGGVEIVYPELTIPDALDDGVRGGRTSLLVGALITAIAYAAISYGMHTNMKRTFMMTVRRLAGTT